MLPLGTKAPNFELPDTAGKTKSLADFADSQLLVVAFICNHCPFVVHIKPELANFAAKYQAQGVGFVAINSNDAEAYPDDSPEAMKAEQEKFAYPFPYLFDESQETAKAYQAACTPDFFLFNQARELIYRGRFDASSPGNEIPVTGEELGKAIEHALNGSELSESDQSPSIGCNIKWKPGAAPAYFPG